MITPTFKCWKIWARMLRKIFKMLCTNFIMDVNMARNISKLSETTQVKGSAGEARNLFCLHKVQQKQPTWWQW